MAETTISKTLVTGATGFVGQRMIRFLVGQVDPSRITCLIQPPADDKHRLAVARLREWGVSLIEGDLDRPEVSDTAAPPFDLLIHIAAKTSTSLKEPELRANDLGIHHLLDWVGTKSRGTRFVYTSTIGVMDRNGPCRGQPVNEETPCYPGTAYSVTKLRGEAVVRERAQRDGFTWTILRLPTVYGPGQMKGGLFDALMEMAKSGSLLGRLDWPGRTSVLHVDDVAKMIWTLGRDPAAANVLLCVASDESLSVSEIGALVGDAIGHPLKPLRVPGAGWSLVRAVAWNRPLRALMRRMPTKVYLPFWRLGLIADDGFWYDTSKLRRYYREPIMTVPLGLRQMLDEAKDLARSHEGTKKS